MRYSLPDHSTLFASSARIQSAINRLAHALNLLYAFEESPVVVVPIMDGACIFSVDLVPLLKFPIELCPIQASSYDLDKRGTTKLGNTFTPASLGSTSKVLLLDDICETGITLTSVSEFLRNTFNVAPSSITTCCLLSRKCSVHLCSYYGLEVAEPSASSWLFGYGMDLNGEFRELPELYSIHPSLVRSTSCK